jgi:anti-sigma-K factor RskA
VNLDDPEDRSIACAEFVMGTLSDEERAAFAAQMAVDAGLRLEVGFWQDRLLGLVRKVAAVEPSERVWQGIEAALPAEPTTTTIARPARQRASPPPWWERLGFWQAVSGMAMAAAVLLASLLVIRPAAPPTSYVAVLQSPDQRAGWVVQASEGAPVKLVALANPGQVPPDRSWQLWTKGKTATAPTSLGLVPGQGGLQVPRDRLPELGDEQLFEITLEPAGGSPTGRPTGPVLFIGKAQRI